LARRTAFYEHFGDAKIVAPGITELRVHFGPGYRLYITRRGKQIVILLCGGDKGSQRRDIAKAVELAALIKE
jgi:putative addiction module killer protein